MKGRGEVVCARGEMWCTGAASNGELSMIFFGHPTPLGFLPVENDYQIVRKTSLLGGRENRFNSFGARCVQSS